MRPRQTPPTSESKSSTRSLAPARRAEISAEDPAALASMIEKNRAIINRGWEDLARLTRMLDALDAREASIVKNDLNPPAPRQQNLPVEAQR